MLKKLFFNMIFFIIFVITGCSSVPLMPHNYSQNRYSNYYVLDIVKGNNYKDELNYIKDLIKKTYIKNNNVSCYTHTKGIINCDLEYKSNYWKQKCVNLTKILQNTFCKEKKKTLNRLQDYFKNPSEDKLAIINAIIMGRNKACLSLRLGVYKCKLIHSINEYYQEVKENYQNCLKKYNACNNPKYRRYKIVVGFKRDKNGLVIVIKKFSNDRNYYNYGLIKQKYSSKISETYVAVKDIKNNKIYLISLEPNKRNSIIFHKELSPITKNKLQELINF